MKKQYLAIVALWLIGGKAMSQNEMDAFRYAQYSPTGTAKYTSLAGSIGAFGADFTSLSANNPAGIGLFKRSEISATLSVPYSLITSTYNGNKQIGVKSSFTVNNLGFVFSRSLPSGTKWSMMQFAVGFNNLARYDGRTIVRGPNIGGILGTTNFFDYIAESSKGTKITSLQGMAKVAYDYYLMDPVSGKDDEYFSVVDDSFDQEQIITSDGSLNEIVFSFGGNYDDKLFVGATLGIPFFNYREETSYYESENYYYESLTIDDGFSAKSTGINFKLGVIYQPVNFVRVGIAFHTPTAFLKVREKYQSEYEFLGVYHPIDSTYSDIWGTISDGTFEYQLTTPYRAMFNAAFIINKYGFVNIDYEFTDYSTSRMQSNRYSFSDENKAIKKYYRETHTVRIGGEVNLHPVSLRLGYSFTSNPYVKELNKDGAAHIISGGIGFKAKKFFADFAYRYRIQNDKGIFYTASSLNSYSSKFANQVFALTVGFKL